MEHHIDVEHMVVVDADGRLFRERSHSLTAVNNKRRPLFTRPDPSVSCLPAVRTRFIVHFVDSSVVVTVYSCSILVPAMESTGSLLGCFPLIGCMHFLYLFYFYIDYDCWTSLMRTNPVSFFLLILQFILVSAYLTNMLN